MATAKPKHRVVPGPAGDALRRMLGADAAADLDLDLVPRSRLGEFRVCPATEDSRGRTRDAGPLEDLRTRISRLDIIDSAVAVPPRIYVRTRLEFLRAAVLDAIEARGHEFGHQPAGSRNPVLITFTDPNTNKPLHVGHMRNLFLGSALASLHRTLGHDTRTEGSLGDWGLHICQAVVAYLRHGEGATPESTGLKGDHFVGRWYARFHGSCPDLTDEARAALLDLPVVPELRTTHDRLVRWARDGIEQTYRRVGLDLDEIFPESEHLDTARRHINLGLERDILRRTEDGAVVLAGADDVPDVVLARSDGTLLVLAQILGVDIDRFDGERRIISVFGQQWEQTAGDYQRLTRALRLPWADRYEPVFYGMVRERGNAIRSRSGSAATADEVIDDVAARLRARVCADPVRCADLTLDPESLALMALKYALVRFPRSKNMDFDIAAVGQRSVAAVESLLRWTDGGSRGNGSTECAVGDPGPATRAVLLQLNGFPDVLQTAADRLDPGVVLSHLDALAQNCNRLRPHERGDRRLLDAVAFVILNGLEATGLLSHLRAKVVAA